MNKKRFDIILLAVAVVGISAFFIGSATASAQPGSTHDPLVTQSYVDAQINMLKALIESIDGISVVPPGGGMVDDLFSDVMAYFEAVYGDMLREASAPREQIPYQAVHVQKGKALIGFSGTEMILRSGRATAITGVNGLCNVTTGVDVLNGTEVTMNHLLIVPANDGRGLRFLTDAYVMVKGGYFIVD